VKLRNLSFLKRADPEEIPLATFPTDMLITKFAWEKALAINPLVNQIHGSSYEWYGLTLAEKEHPECIVDIGIPVNASNVHRHTGIDPESIALFRESLPANQVINGWIHSHGSLGYKRFSRTDETNHVTVLDYVSTFLKTPLARREVLIEDTVLLTRDSMKDAAGFAGNVWIVTDNQVSEARIFEKVYGFFSYAILVGDGGWHRQEIYCRTRGILTGTEYTTKKEAQLFAVESGKMFTERDKELLTEEIRDKVNPPERFFIKDMNVGAQDMEADLHR
jgi:hypothetical protein